METISASQTPLVEQPNVGEEAQNDDGFQTFFQEKEEVKKILSALDSNQNDPQVLSKMVSRFSFIVT